MAFELGKPKPMSEVGQVGKVMLGRSEPLNGFGWSNVGRGMSCDLGPHEV